MKRRRHLQGKIRYQAKYFSIIRIRRGTVGCEMNNHHQAFSTCATHLFMHVPLGITRFFLASLFRLALPFVAPTTWEVQFVDLMITFSFSRYLISCLPCFRPAPKPFLVLNSSKSELDSWKRTSLGRKYTLTDRLEFRKRRCASGT
jgi:hypothetical protein